MEKVKIFTDSCSDLPEDVVEQYNIGLIPTPVHFGEEEYLDRGNLTPGEFYQKIEQISELPRTSQIPPAVFIREFEQALEDGYQVLSLNFSSRLSGIYDSAVLAKENLGSDKIHIIDTRCASVGFGMCVVKAASLLQEGRGIEETIENVLDYAAHMEHIFAVGSLEMLQRGGRIKKSTAFVGNILNIKPILHFQDGEILPLSRVRGTKKMLEYLLEVISERGERVTEQEMVGINHSGSPELADKMARMIEEQFGIDNYLISEIGAAIGSHVGRGTVSVFFQSRERVANPELS